MTRTLRSFCSGLLFAVALAVAPASAQQSVIASDASADDGVVLASCTSCDDCGMMGCDCATDYCASGCSVGGCDLGTGLGGGLRAGQVFVGAEWLSLRANFSEATAYRVINTNPPAMETLEQFNFNYGDSYRIYGGYRLNECGDEIRFTYTNFSSDGGFSRGPIDNPTVSGLIINGPYELVLSGEGDTIEGFADVDIDTYDIAFAKTIPLGCPMVCCDPCCGDSCCGDACCDTGCGDCCGCGPVCPAWDIQFIGGIRVANVDSSLNYQSTVVNPGANPPSRFAQSRVEFDGVGLRGGVLARRYIGRKGLFSAYVRGDISALLGDVEYQATVSSGVFLPAKITSTQVVPVTELEAGVTANLSYNLQFTAGYMLSAWHDLGHRAEYDYSATGTQLTSMDDANLMTFDGFFLRAEAAF